MIRLGKPNALNPRNAGNALSGILGFCFIVSALALTVGTLGVHAALIASGVLSLLWVIARAWPPILLFCICAGAAFFANNNFLSSLLTLIGGAT